MNQFHQYIASPCTYVVHIGEPECPVCASVLQREQSRSIVGCTAGHGALLLRLGVVERFEVDCVFCGIIVYGERRELTDVNVECTQKVKREISGAIVVRQRGSKAPQDKGNHICIHDIYVYVCVPYIPQIRNTPWIVHSLPCTYIPVEHHHAL